MAEANRLSSYICLALLAQDKIYPYSNACRGELRSTTLDNLMALDTKSNSLDDASEYIKALAPWIKDDQKRIRLRDESCRCFWSAYTISSVSLEV